MKNLRILSDSSKVSASLKKHIQQLFHLSTNHKKTGPFEVCEGTDEVLKASNQQGWPTIIKQIEQIINFQELMVGAPALQHLKHVLILSIFFEIAPFPKFFIVMVIRTRKTMIFCCSFDCYLFGYSFGSLFMH